jgi:hypothetical protein
VDLAISALYKMVLKASESQPTTPVKINYYKTVNPLSDMLLKHWTASFVGPSFSILRDKIRDYEKDNAFDYYSKLLLFVQSSGTGKSRLADHFGKSYPTINYVIRKGEYGYPPNDPEILEYMQCNSFMNDDNVFLSPEYKNRAPNSADQQQRKLNIWFHALAVGILQASFEICKYLFLYLSWPATC